LRYGFLQAEPGFPFEAAVTAIRGAQGHAGLWFLIVGGVIAVAGLFLPAAKAFALWDDKLTLFAEEKATRDDNVFRISKNAAPEDIGASSRGDTYRTTSLGLNFDVPVSRQRFQGAFARNDTRYDQLTGLDFTGHEARAMWLWQLGNDASGQLGYTETLALASFANIVSFKNDQSSRPDPLKTRQALFSAAYLVTPRWRLNAGVSGLELTNGDTARQSFDLDVLYTEVALSYVTPANTSVGLSARTEDGRYPKSPVDNAYRQTSAGVVADWTPTGASHLSARGDRFSRRYADVSLQTFDFVGYTARGQYDWKLTGKLSLAAVAQRDIFPYQDIGSSFVLVKGVALRPTLRVTEKIDVSGTVDYSIREFLPSPGQTSGSSTSRTDRVKSVAATLSYRPARTFTLLLSAQREARSSDFVPPPPPPPPASEALPADYLVNVFSISARITF
jgi:exopolysaccharide biosynthesis operon protein EpsL